MIGPSNCEHDIYFVMGPYSADYPEQYHLLFKINLVQESQALEDASSVVLPKMLVEAVRMPPLVYVARHRLRVSRNFAPFK